MLNKDELRKLSEKGNERKRKEREERNRHHIDAALNTLTSQTETFIKNFDHRLKNEANDGFFNLKEMIKAPASSFSVKQDVENSKEIKDLIKKVKEEAKIRDLTITHSLLNDSKYVGFVVFIKWDLLS